MANGILASLFSKTALVIKSTNGDPSVLSGLKVLRVRIRFDSTLMRHMREDGTTTTDSRIIRPCRVEIQAIAPSLSVLGQVNTLLEDRENVYTIVSKGVIMTPMMSEGNLVKQSPEMLSASPVTIYFKQLLGERIRPVTCEQPGDSSLLDVGIASLKSTVSSAAALAGSIF